MDQLSEYMRMRLDEFNLLTSDRKLLLEKIAGYIRLRLSMGKTAKLVFICTHNSRRSHLGMIWAKAAAAYYNVAQVDTYSGGTEATAFHDNAVAALKRSGMLVHRLDDHVNPRCEVVYSRSCDKLICFSKVFDHASNPASDFAAVMTCSDAGENCPFVPGADMRLALYYDDPRLYDGTDLQDRIYDERCAQIAREMLYVFSLVTRSY